MGFHLILMSFAGLSFCVSCDSNLSLHIESLVSMLIFHSLQTVKLIFSPLQPHYLKEFFLFTVFISFPLLTPSVPTWLQPSWFHQNASYYGFSGSTSLNTIVLLTLHLAGRLPLIRSWWTHPRALPFPGIHHLAVFLLHLCCSFWIHGTPPLQFIIEKSYCSTLDPHLFIFLLST